jgi:putative transposase
MQNRKVTYRLYPNLKQAERLSEMLALHQRVYNAALEDRIDLYREKNKSISFAGQCKTLTQWRHTHQELVALNAQSLQVTLKRLDLAFQSFFRRIKNNEKPGFPRFKSLHRYPGWGYKSHGDGWRLFPGEKGKHGKLRLSGVGTIDIRGQARTMGEPKTCEILNRSDKWYVSVTINCNPVRMCGTKSIALDWGVEKFLTTFDSQQQTNQIENPRYVKSALKELKLLQQSVSRKTNKQSHNRKKAIKSLAKLHGQLASRRKDFHHQIAANFVKENGLIAVEALSIRCMTTSGGSRKKGLNREILSTAPAQFHQILKSKAEEAGVIWVEIPTRIVKPSQTCYQCKTQKKKALSERWHSCSCGASCHRDENAARVDLDYALAKISGQELAEAGSRGDFATLNHETLAISLDWRE